MVQLSNTVTFNMYYGASYDIMNKAKSLRKTMTESEKILWEKLKNRQLLNLKFRRQHPINYFIADFYCHEIKFVIEIDGSIHKLTKEYDLQRDIIFNQFGIKVIRLTNKEIFSDIGQVIIKLETFITSQPY